MLRWLKVVPKKVAVALIVTAAKSLASKFWPQVDVALSTVGHWLVTVWASPVVVRHPLLWALCLLLMGCAAGMGVLRYYVSTLRRRLTLLPGK
jgi:hypothetical protein